ncbi:uncharacterized protein BO66DRAFT_433435 [Aspergillus aculeatinus CBS 121060]|uniref:Uncharacterized protein n=1 Tax=Aspergillus aculeatinus CBS 121060 TaxID=1448322 RepID=A0ACD1HP78_9EURO|nr:hypothetical protein BO66DRAFT_433435 [Aspergillus aculeatinus CBS 121060]RAH75356.1 hypothetical protein BO66DRAFT_433435 [Aspergillus aculeatinus CBS 121060]
MAPIPQVMSDASSPEEGRRRSSPSADGTILLKTTDVNGLRNLAASKEVGYYLIPVEGNLGEISGLSVEANQTFVFVLSTEPFCVLLRAVFCPAFCMSPWKTKTHGPLPTSGNESSGTGDDAAAAVDLAPVAPFPVAFLPRSCSSRGAPVVVDADSSRTSFVASLSVIEEEEEEEEEEEKAKMKDE